MSEKVIRIACTGAETLDIEWLNEFQGDLKSLSKENFEKLKNEIIETGFAYPIHVWRHDGVKYIVGGHQRKRVLMELRKDGWTVPFIPVVYVEANSIQEAKRRVLQDISQYGQIEYDGLYEFMKAAEIEPDQLKNFDLPDIDTNKFLKGYFEDEELSTGEGTGGVPPNGSKELDRKDFQNFEHTCPKCGFGFNDPT